MPELRRPSDLPTGSPALETFATSVTTHDRVRISLTVYRRGSRDALVIVCPGFFQSKDTPTFRQLCRALAVEFDVLALDFRGHGRSGGLFAFSALEGADLQAALSWAVARYPRVAVAGFSLGGAVAINRLAGERNGVRCLLAVSTPAVFEDIEFKFWTRAAMRTGLRGLELGAGCRPGNPLLPKERPLDNIARLHGLPILLVHGTGDVIVSASHSQRLFAAAGEPKRLELLANGGHAEDLFRARPVPFMSLVRSWLAEWLPGG